MLKSLSCKLTAKSFLWPLFIVSFLLLLLILYYCTQIEISHNLDGLQSGPNSDHPCATHSAAFQDHFVVPNHVHFVHFNTPNFSFVSFVCIASALINHRPERVIIHTNVNTTELDQDRFVRCPDLVHREPVLLGVQGLAHELYEMMWDQWRKYYTVHLLFRHREYLTPGDQNQSGIMEFDEVNVWNYNHTFGAMARQVLSNIQDFP
eukprot:TCALIF_06477-PA protein Name:"Protein of unknown function" AED:0.35 eAED:0.40 QI:22/0/0/1/0/0/2/0/205